MRSGDSALSFAEITTVPHAMPAAMLAVWKAHVRAQPFFGSLPTCRQAPHRWTAPLVQLSPFQANCLDTIHIPACPPASVPVVLNLCHAVVSMMLGGPAR